MPTRAEAAPSADRGGSEAVGDDRQHAEQALSAVRSAIAEARATILGAVACRLADDVGTPAPSVKSASRLSEPCHNPYAFSPLEEGFIVAYLVAHLESI